jgi:hypothetical protein
MKLIEILLAIYILILSFAGSEQAYAYLDPGTGSIVLQTVIAAIFGSLFAIKMFWHRIVATFKKLTGQPTNPTESDQ